MKIGTVGLITILALGILVAPLAAEARQAAKIARIGVLFASTPAATVHFIEAFRQVLREHGYVEGKTFVLELRYGEARAERLPELARGGEPRSGRDPDPGSSFASLISSTIPLRVPPSPAP